MDAASLVLPLERRTIIRFTGPDAQRYLNGQVTQDIRPLASGMTSAPACVTDTKGRLNALVRIIAADQHTWFVEAPAREDTSLLDLLTRHLIADDAEATDVSGFWYIIHYAASAPIHPPSAALIRASNRFGVEGYDVWLPAADTIIRENSPPHPSCRDYLETRRIEAGIPEWKTDAIQEMLPAELGLDRTSVSFAKGCYVGQEVISRMAHAGRVNRRLTRFSLNPLLPPLELSGAVLTAAGREAREQAGVITSIAPLLSEDGWRAALAMVVRPWLDTTEFDVILSDGTSHPSAARTLGPA